MKSKPSPANSTSPSSAAVLNSPGTDTHADPSLMTGPNVGAALKAVRISRGLSLEQMAETTRVRLAYLTAIETFSLDQLPSRPFTIGYIRAYAQALGLDGQMAVERFRADSPLLNDGLASPIGVDNSEPGLGAITIGAMIVVAGIIAWNVAQRTAMEEAPPLPSASASAIARATPIQTKGYVELGEPLPAPAESTAPAPYETPGLAKAMSGVESTETDPTAGDPGLPPMPARFNTRSDVLGASASESEVILQARKSASLIVRGSDGSTYFARQLSTGQAYRVPNIPGLTIEVFDAGALQIFVAGESRGAVPVGRSSLTQLLPSP